MDKQIKGAWMDGWMDGWMVWKCFFFVCLCVYHDYDYDYDSDYRDFMTLLYSIAKPVEFQNW